MLQKWLSRPWGFQCPTKVPHNNQLMLTQVAACFELVKAHEMSQARATAAVMPTPLSDLKGSIGQEERRNSSYAWVVRARFDTAFFRPVPPVWTWPRSKVWVKGTMLNGVHDQFALVTSRFND